MPEPKTYRPAVAKDPHTNWPVLVLEDEDGSQAAVLTPPPGSKAARKIVYQLAAAPHLADAVEAALQWLDAYGRQAEEVVGGEAELERRLRTALNLYRGNFATWHQVETERRAA